MTNGEELLDLGNLTGRKGYEKYEVRSTKDEGVELTPYKLDYFHRQSYTLLSNE